MKRVLIYVAIAGVLGIAAVPPASAQQTIMPTTEIAKFAQELPLLGPTGLPVVDGTVPATLSICEFQTQILPPPHGKTWVWGYQVGDTCDPDPGHSYIGPVVVAQRGTPTQMTFINQLPDADPYGILGGPSSNVLAFTKNTDLTMHWADPTNDQDNTCSEALSQGFLLPSPECNLNYTGPIAAAVHLHGGEVPPDLDGGPDSWWTTDGTMRGHGYYTREVATLPDLTDPAIAADFPFGCLVKNQTNGTYYRNDFGTWTQTTDIDRATYVYPNTQEAANTWFHDHVLGFTRLNVYAGIAGAYVIQDPAETNPDLGPVTNLVPLVIQDRFFDQNGELFFSEPGMATTPEHPYWVAEFIGDVAVVNGAAWPTMTVEPKRYRFLFLNGSNSRGYDLFLHQPAGIKPNGKPSKEKAGPPMYVIGTDGGYLDAPATINPRNDTPGNPAKLVLLPGERYEVIVDFSGFAGKTLEMRNTAFNPYPFGPEPPIAQIMQFQVANAVTSPGVVYDPTLYDPLNPATSPRVTPIERLDALAAAPLFRRQLTLNEVGSTISGAPLEALLNNTKWNGFQIIEDGDGVSIPNTIQPRLDFVEAFQDYLDPTYYSELPGEGTVEVWEIINITADAHPIHLHLVQFQILGRQPIDPVCYNAIYDGAFPLGVYEPGYGPPHDYNIPNADGAVGGNPAPSPCFVGGMKAPGAFESGWKDTAVMYPDEITKIAVRWAPTDIPNTVTDMTQLGFPFDPNHGHGYVWHCHILDHEDNEMMRPTQVNTNTLFPPANRDFVKGIDY